MTRTIPKVNELEISLFGPGYGESILLHIGDDNWIIIDSCIDKKSNEPAALNYLKSIGVDPSKDVKLVIATHWHDDHIRGLGKIVEECTEATFVCSTAIKNIEFLQLLEIYRSRQTANSNSGICEFISVFNTLEKRNVPPKFAIADRKIWHHIHKHDSLTECVVHALSPSDAEVVRAIRSVSHVCPKPGTDPTRLSPPRQNESAVVLWINMGNDNILLLGSDIEESNNPQTGWSAILGAHVEENGEAAIYKVAHHGSENGHHQEVWDTMLIDQPWALLTPFSRGRKPLPSPNDIGRIVEQTNNAFITTPPHRIKKRKRKDRLVKQFVNKYTKYIKNAESPCGQIVMRKLAQAVNDNWDIELYEGACRLN